MKRIFTLIVLLTLFQATGLSQDRNLQQGTPARFIRFYPNPATTFINIEFQRAQLRNTSFQVFNFLGKKVVELQDLNGKTRIDLTGYSRGIYIYLLKDRNGKVIESGKFQIEK